MRKDIAHHPGRNPHDGSRGNGHGPRRGTIGAELGAPDARPTMARGERGIRPAEFGRPVEARGIEGRGHHGGGRGIGAPPPGGPGERGMGHGMGWGGRRMFGSGGVKLAVLKLLSEEPAHGYQLIKKMEERLAGGYTPSAGAIYPTLSLLEDEGLIAATQQENRKMYSVTAEGTSYLEENKARVEAIFAHLEEAGRVFARGRTPELTRALDNLRGAVSARVARGNATPEQFCKMAEAIDTAAKSIDAL